MKALVIFAIVITFFAAVYALQYWILGLMYGPELVRWWHPLMLGFLYGGGCAASNSRR